MGWKASGVRIEQYIGGMPTCPVSPASMIDAAIGAPPTIATSRSGGARSGPTVATWKTTTAQMQRHAAKPKAERQASSSKSRSQFTGNESATQPATSHCRSTLGKSSAAFCQMMMFMLRMAKKVSTIDETITSHLPGGPIAWNPICAYDGTVSPRAAIVLYDSTISAPV